MDEKKREEEQQRQDEEAYREEMEKLTPEEKAEGERHYSDGLMLGVKIGALAGLKLTDNQGKPSMFHLGFMSGLLGTLAMNYSLTAIKTRPQPGEPNASPELRRMDYATFEPYFRALIEESLKYAFLKVKEYSADSAKAEEYLRTPLMMAILGPDGDFLKEFLKMRRPDKFSENPIKPTVN